jgi:hypothetical protein
MRLQDSLALMVMIKDFIRQRKPDGPEVGAPVLVLVFMEA